MAEKNNSCTKDTYYLNNYCNNMANQYLFLVSIYSAIISEEIEDDETLGILGSFLVALGEEIALASEIRIFCKSKFEENSNEKTSETDIEDVFDRCYSKKTPKNKYKKIKRKKRRLTIDKKNI